MKIFRDDVSLINAIIKGVTYIEKRLKGIFSRGSVQLEFNFSKEE
jgi:hypothetical protein